jgi:hypothetical protein
MKFVGKPGLTDLFEYLQDYGGKEKGPPSHPIDKKDGHKSGL